MKISESSRSELEQSLNLPGSAMRAVVALLRVTSCCAARLASRARAARMMRATIDSATLLLWIQPVLERRPDGAIDGRDQLGIVQPILRLSLELRLGDEEG